MITTSVREKCIICAREGANGGLCGYCEKFHLPYPDCIDPQAECSVCFKIFPLWNTHIIDDRVILCASCYKKDRSLHRQKSVDT